MSLGFEALESFFRALEATGPPSGAGVMQVGPKALSLADEFFVPQVPKVPKRLGKTGIIKLAMETNRALDFDYTRKRDGGSERYNTHPYSWRYGKSGAYLYASEAKHGYEQIHSFIYSRVRNVELKEEQPYIPLWPTEPESL